MKLRKGLQALAVGSPS